MLEHNGARLIDPLGRCVQGVADGVHGVTAWPSALTVVQSWDTAAMMEYGAAMGAEQCALRGPPR